MIIITKSYNTPSHISAFAILDTDDKMICKIEMDKMAKPAEEKLVVTTMGIPDVSSKLTGRTAHEFWMQL